MNLFNTKKWLFFDKNIALFILLLLLTNCTYQNPEKSGDRAYTSAELLGKWEQVSKDKSLDENDHQIEYIQLVNDSVAEVQIKDATGVRKVPGKWKYLYKKRKKINFFIAIDFFIASDIRVVYSSNDHQCNMLLMGLSEKKGKLIMSVNEYQFEKNNFVEMKLEL